MKQIILKAAAFSFAIVLLFSAVPGDATVMADADKIVNEEISAVSASDDSTVHFELNTPIIAKKAVYSGKLELSAVNISSYSQDADFEIEINGQLARTQSMSMLKSAGCLFTTVDGKGYLEPSKEYRVRVRVVDGEAFSDWSSELTLYTNSKTYYCVEKGTAFSTVVNGKLINTGKLPQTVFAHGVVTDVEGDVCEGEDALEHTARYIKLIDSDYEDCYVSISQAARVANTAVLENKPEIPELRLGIAFSDEFTVKLENFDKYDPETVFDISVDGRYVKTVSYKELEKQGCVLISNTASGFLTPDTKYKVSVEAQYRQLRSRTFSCFTTDSVSYYKVDQGKPYYTYYNDEFVCAGLASYIGFGKGISVNEKGDPIEGKAISAGQKDYVKITEGDFAGYYIKASDAAHATGKDVEENDKRKEEEAKRAAEAEKAARAAREAAAQRAKEQAEALKKAEEAAKNAAADGELTDRDAKIAKVCAYARANAGGVYVFAGCNFRATDCSGLTMLAYRQIGVNLSHNAAAQANEGRRVSLSEIQPGDLIITSGYGHVMIYVGNGEVTHAIDYGYGIQTQKMSDVLSRQYVNAVVRII